MATFKYLPRTVPTTSLVMDIPFNLGNLGRVATIPETDHKIYQNQVISVMGTNPGERIWYERYTAGIGDTLFENSDDAVGLIQKSISEAFVRWLPQLSFIKADTSYDQTTGLLDVTITYRTPTGFEDSVKIITSSLTPSGETTVVAYGR